MSHSNCPCGTVCCCRQVEALLPKEAEFGVPMWVFGARTYCLLEGGKYILTQYNDPTTAGGCVDVRAEGGVLVRVAEILEQRVRDVTQLAVSDLQSVPSLCTWSMVIAAVTR